LLNKNISYRIIDRYTDVDENILGIKIEIGSSTIWLISVYGPNTNEANFFNNLDELLGRCGAIPVLIGGDWNATISTLDSPDNIDIFGMQRPPSALRSANLNNLCINYTLTDPFRALHPDLRDFSYIPRTGRNNRSRLDFFLISDSILYNVTNCHIGKSLTTSLFDHKPVFLTIGDSNVVPTGNIFNSTLNHPLFDSVVLLNIFDTYFNHADPGTDNLVNLKTILGHAMSKICELNNLDWDAQIQNVPVPEQQRNNLLGELAEAIARLPGIDTVSEFDLTCDPDTFFEVLCANLKNELLGFQSYLKKLENAKLNRIYARIDQLRNDYLINHGEIAILENEATQVLDSILVSKVSCMKIFENLNAEKPTPLFMSLTKNRNSEKLSLIKDDNGNEFLSDELRNNHIVETFEKLYRNRDTGNLPVNVIEDFLGPDVLDSPIVRNSVLTNAESEWLDRPLTLAELDISAKRGKIRSAPGADGFSNQLIMRCWKYFRKAFFAYTMHCHAIGTLTHNFRSAKIRLIPKKGELNKLKNWRPISLLSNFYKILSRAINTRLNKFVNRICSRAQKGYNSCRYAQEALINVWEQVSHCRNNNLRGAVVAIDMAKAFDTLSHEFLTKVYKFFNFGPVITSWLHLLGNNREACIVLDNNLNSRYFKLGRGRPQGDNVSPNTFNFADQILIFKIELDPRIAKIREIPQSINQPFNDFFDQEANRETANNESLADDNTTITLLQRDSLVAIKEILNNFAIISGLECNFDKSSIMPTFVPDPADIALIEELGFSYTQKIKLLGVDITYDLSNVDDIFNKIKEKIVDLVSYWERFRLTLPGRITIAKTFLISQLNYIGCFLKPSINIINEIQTVIYSFVKKNLNIAQHRFADPVEDGGLGLFNLSEFLASQRCAWILRAHQLQIDNWRFDLKKMAPANNILLIRPCDIDAAEHPILFNIVKDFQEFYGKFCQPDGNFRNSFVFDNPIFKLGPDYTNTILPNTFGRIFYENYHVNLRSLTYNMCFIEGVFKSPAEFAEAGLPLSVAAWMRLRSCLLRTRDLLTKPDPIANTRCLDIGNFMSKKLSAVKDLENSLRVPVLHRNCEL
jgi:hypothetical protein